MSRVAELSEALASRIKKMQDFSVKGIEIDGANVEVKQGAADEYKKLYAEASEIKELLVIEKFGVDTSKWLSGTEGKDLSAAMEHAAMSRIASAGMHAKTLGQLFTDSDEFKTFAKAKRTTMAEPFELTAYDLSKGGLQQKDVYGGLDAHTISMGVGTRVQFDPMIPRAQRPTRVRDLFPAAATSANLIDYFQVIGFAENNGEGNAQTVPDYQNGTFGLKPQSKLRFKSQQAPVRTIAHWEAAHRNVINDVPALQATINNELLYGLSLVEDDQILNGDGQGENLKGLLRHEGIQVYTAPALEIKSDSLRRATTLAMLANYPPNGYVVHPNDWEDVELQKGTGDGQYMLFTNVAIGINAQVWRQPVVETAAMNEGTFVNGAFGTGAQLYDRQRASVRIAEQHADFFVRNAVVILCEERLALAVKRPEAFVRGAFA